MRYLTLRRVMWLVLIIVGAALTLTTPGHIVAIIGSAVAATTSFVFYPLQPWWGMPPGEPAAPLAPVSAARGTVAYVSGYVLCLLCIGAGWFVIELTRLGTS